MSDHPVDEVLASMEKLIAAGHDCYVKYTCENCGSRQCSEEANTWRVDGYTCSECQHVTKPTGINFLAHLKLNQPGGQGTKESS